MGSGKSSLAQLFAEWGAALVDADKLTHQVLQRPEVMAGLQEAFGDDVVGRDGRLDRPEVGRRAFASQRGWRLLNQVVRPPLEKRFWEEVERLQAAENRMVVVDAPLLFEWESRERFDVIVVVDADEGLRIERVKVRSGLTDAEIRQRMAYQMPAAEKKRQADFVVYNNGDPGDLQRQAKKLWLVLRQKQREYSLPPGD